MAAHGIHRLGKSAPLIPTYRPRGPWPWLPAALCVTLAACGGGGGGGSTGGTNGNPYLPSPTMVVTPLEVQASATSTQSAPAASVQVSVDNLLAGQQVYLSGTDTTHGIASVSDANSANPVTVNIQFKAPATLGPGTYDDTVTLDACYDTACTRPVADSPQTVQVQYTVTASPLTLAALNPASAQAGGASFTLTATGTGFTTQSSLQWNGNQIPTTFVSSTELSAQIPASDITTTGTVPVSVFDPSDGTTGSLNFTIQPAVLGLTGISPTSVTVGGPAFMLTVLGTGFTNSSTVLWNGATRPTTFVSEDELVAQIGASDISALGTESVAVQDPTSSVGTTTAQTLTVAATSIDAVSYQMNPAHTGAVNFKSVTFPSTSLWTANVGGPASYALIVGGRVFVTVSVNGNSELLALDAATGATLWGPIAFAGTANAAYDSGRLFVISGTGVTSQIISALDPATGNSEWSANVSGGWFPAPPVAADGMVFAVNGGDLNAFNGTNGAALWQQAVTGTSGMAAASADGVYTSAPCTTFDLRPATGETIWTNNTGCEGGGGETPVVANGVTYSPINGNYSGTRFNAETGTVLGDFSGTNIPAITSSTEFMLNAGTLQGISLSNSQILWSFAGDGSLDSAPIVVNGYVFVGSSNGNLYALDGSTGAQVWTQNVGTGIETSSSGSLSIYTGLAAGDGLLVVPAGNDVIAYQLSTNP